MSKLFFGSFIFLSLAVCGCGGDDSTGPTGGGDGGGGGGGSGGGSTSGSSSSGTSSSESSSSGTGGVLSAQCAKICALIAPVCPSDNDATCGPRCTMNENGNCSAAWKPLIECVLQSSAMYMCENNQPIIKVCTDEAIAFASCK